MRKMTKVIVCSVLALLTLTMVIGGKVILSSGYFNGVEIKSEKRFESGTKKADADVEEVFNNSSIQLSKADIKELGTVKADDEKKGYIIEEAATDTSTLENSQTEEVKEETTEEVNASNEIKDVENSEEKEVNIDRTPQISSAVFYNPNLNKDTTI